MNTEEIKLVLEIFTKLSTEAKFGFTVWLIADKVLPILAWLVVAALCYITTLRFMPYARANRTVMRLRDEARIGCGGYLIEEEIENVERHYLDLQLKHKEAIKAPYHPEAR